MPSALGNDTGNRCSRTKSTITQGGNAVDEKQEWTEDRLRKR
jgi:hypothetical protein